jgi:hypothetical protein
MGASHSGMESVGRRKGGGTPKWLGQWTINVSAVSGAARRDCLSGMDERGSPGRFRYSRLKEAVLERCGYGV